MEAFLQREYGVDLRDLWRPGRNVTLRRLVVLVGEFTPWTLEAHLLDDVRRTIAAGAGQKNPKVYPSRFDAAQPAMTPERAKKLADARRRSLEMRRRREQGGE